MKTSYIVGTGWWDDGQRKSHHEKYGGLEKADFFNIWYYFLNKYSSPQKIIMMDSASPIKPKLPNDPRLEFVSLDQNYGHGSFKTFGKIGQFQGWTKAMMLGAFYTLMTEADYYVYIEQDCLIYGYGIIEKAIENMEKNNKKMSHGWFNHPSFVYKAECCLTIIHRSYLLEFLELLLKTPYEGELIGIDELKFVLIANFEEFKKSYLILRAKKVIQEMDLEKLKLNNIPSHIPLPFGFGRLYGYNEIRAKLPLPKLPEHFYIQQFTIERLDQIMKLEGIKNPYKLRKK